MPHSSPVIVHLGALAVGLLDLQITTHWFRLIASERARCSANVKSALMPRMALRDANTPTAGAAKLAMMANKAMVTNSSMSVKPWFRCRRGFIRSILNSGPVEQHAVNRSLRAVCRMTLGKLLFQSDPHNALRQHFGIRPPWNRPETRLTDQYYYFESCLRFLDGGWMAVLLTRIAIARDTRGNFGMSFMMKSQSPIAAFVPRALDAITVEVWRIKQQSHTGLD